MKLEVVFFSVNVSPRRQHSITHIHMHILSKSILDTLDFHLLFPFCNFLLIFFAQKSVSFEAKAKNNFPSRINMYLTLLIIHSSHHHRRSLIITLKKYLQISRNNIRRNREREGDLIKCYSEAGSHSRNRLCDSAQRSIEFDLI